MLLSVELYIRIALAVVGCAWLGKALFGSFFLQELIKRYLTPERGWELFKLNWEVDNKAKWDYDVFQNSQTARKQILDESILQLKMQKLEHEMKGTFWLRAAQYLSSCVPCQSGGAAIIMFCLVFFKIDFLLIGFAIAGATWFFRDRILSRECPNGKCGGNGHSNK